MLYFLIFRSFAAATLMINDLAFVKVPAYPSSASFFCDRGLSQSTLDAFDYKIGISVQGTSYITSAQQIGISMKIFPYCFAVLSCNSGDFPDRSTVFIKGLYLFDKLPTLAFGFRQVIHSQCDFFYPFSFQGQKNSYPFQVGLLVCHS